MKLENSKLVFVAVGLVGVLLFSSPTLALVVHLPSGEKFSELWLLGPNQMANDYPFNVTENVNYTVYVGVGDHMGSSAYYMVNVKFRNSTEPLPNITSGVKSPLPPLYSYHFLLEDGLSWESLLTFSFSNVSFSENQCTVGSLRINGVDFAVDNTAVWDVAGSGYYYQLFLELWICDPKSDAFVFHDRFVSLWLNMTAPSS
jgi:hypothetical protein